MFKNVASQKWTVLAFNASTGARVTGDAANISAKIEQDDDGVLSASNDVAPTEAEDGIYKFDLTQAETNGDKITIYPESSTGSVIVIGCPTVVYTRPQYFPDFAIASDGDFAGNVDGSVASVVGSVGSVTGHTNQTADHAASIALILTDTSTTLQAELDAIQAAVITNAAGVDVAADIIALKAETALIVADTNELQTDDVPGLIATAQADLDTLTGSDGATLATAQGLYAPAKAGDSMALTAGGVDAVWDEVLTGATHNVTDSAGRRLRQIDAAFEVHAGTAQAGAATTITLDTGASAIDEIYRGDRIIITEGTGAEEHGICTAYNGTTKVATMAETWVVTPDATSVFEVVPASVDIETWQHSVVTGDGDWAALKAETALIVADTNELQGDDVPGLIATAQADLDTLTGTDGATLATAQALYAPALASVATEARLAELDAANLPADIDTILVGAATIVQGTASGTPTTTTMPASALTEATDDHYNGRIIIWTSGVLKDQATDITDYDGGTKTFTFTAVTEGASSGDTFVIV